MVKRDSVKFFVRFLLLTILTILLISMSFVFANMGDFGLIIGLVIVVINVGFLVYYLFKSFHKLFKHIFDKEKPYFDFMYLVNVMFTVLINGVFLAFYFTIMAVTFIALIPFIA